jgi:hypothetical protein
MQSTFSWLDHSEEQRRRMMEVVGLFREKGTLDELGIGAVRDAISELLFPGTSTLHTRAKYLLFLPWIFLGLERDRVSSRAAAERVKRDEIRLIYALERGDAGEGIIGIDARERLSQFPSQVYWSALGRYGIRRLPVTRSQYLRSLDNYYVRLRRVSVNDEGESDDGVPRNWHAQVPPAPDGFLDHTTFELSQVEADYLTERILDRCRGTYLAHLIAHADSAVDTEAPWMHPAVASAPPAVAEHLDHARVFSVVMHGAALLYNLILAEKVHDTRSRGGEFAVDTDLVNTDLVPRYRAKLDDWVQHMRSSGPLLDRWDRQRFWALVTEVNPRIPPRTVRFINRWIAIALSRPDQVGRDEEARRLIEHREIQVKRALARVANPRALERWSGASGVAPLEFRWTQVRRIAADIVTGRTSAKEPVDAGT